jgi:DNA recombination protein RmuC
MEVFIFISVAVLFLGFVFVFFTLTKKISELKKPEDENANLMLQQQLEKVVDTLDYKIGETNKVIDQKLSETNTITKGQSTENARVIQGISKDSQEQIEKINKQLRDVTEKLTKVDEANRRVVEFSSQLKDLQDILKNPKQRGILGEYYLEETLKNVLPPNSYQMQYGFKDGTIVDAIVKVKEKIIPVDSKFSLDNYEQLINCKDAQRREVFKKRFRQDLKKRIDETSKYVKPAEKTVDFAFMFIPSESIYYDLLTTKVGTGTSQISSRDLIDYAFKKHVIIVSPTSFLAYLQTVLQGLRALDIEESAKEIQKNVEKLGKHISSYEDYHQRLGNSLATTVNHYNKSAKEFKKVDKDVTKITEGEEGGKIKEIELEKPLLEE